MGAKFEAIKHATSTGIMWHCENNLEQGSRIQDIYKKDWKKVEEEIAFKGRSKWVCRVCQFKCVSYFKNPTS